MTTTCLLSGYVTPGPSGEKVCHLSGLLIVGCINVNDMTGEGPTSMEIEEWKGQRHVKDTVNQGLSIDQRQAQQKMPA